MPTPALSQKISSVTKKVTFEDDLLAAGGITINQDAYNVALDRIYDLRDFDKLFIEVENTHAANGFTYKVQKATKTFTDVTTLVAADFVDGLVTEAAVAALTKAVSNPTLTPEITAMQIRIKRTVASADATLKGVVRGK